MNKQFFLFSLSSGFLLFNSVYASEPQNKVVLDTNQTVEKTKYISKAKINPTYNITNVLETTPTQTNDIYFSADSLENDSQTETATATGNVEIIREDLTLRADKVVYNHNSEDIYAEGNVVLLEKSGNVLFADKINLTNQMQHADVENIKVILLDKTRLAAKSFHKKSNNRKILRNAVYTPCDNCKSSSPLWQIKSTKVIHKPVEQNVEYQNAFLEIKGVPVLYTPFFSHPDPSVKHRSGFLFPRIISSNFLGAAIQPQYFWDINPQTNITFNPIISTNKDPVYSMILNKYFYRGELNASGSVLQDKDYNDKEVRGNLFLYGRYEINDYWVADTDINYVSDHHYLHDLNLPKKDDPWLTSRLRMQAFDNRNHAYLEGYYYDMLSYHLQKANKPYVFPIMGYENISNPDQYGAYVRTALSAASVYHKEDNSSQRLTMQNSWNLPYTSPYGEKYKITASLKSDLYYINNYVNPQNQEFTGTTARIFPQLGLEWRFPFIKTSSTSSQILEPIVVGVLAPNKDSKQKEIPNDDSRDVELTDTNIFDLDRYSGYDRNDTGSRISYGLNWSSYGKKWGRSSVLLAQTYEFQKNPEIFQRDLDEENHFSDYVGRIYAAPSNFFDIVYRFKLDKETYDFTYSELSNSIGNDFLRFGTSYIFFPKSTESSLYQGQERKEIFNSVHSKITRNWSLNAFNRYDLENKQIISNGGGVSYEDECTRIAFQAEKDYSEDPDNENDFSFYITFYLKTIGGVGTK